MPDVNQRTIILQLMSTTSEVETAEVITSGDSLAYVLEVYFMDVPSISGECHLRFILGDEAETEVEDVAVIDGNHISYTLPEALYALPYLICWVTFVDSNIEHTNLKISFTGIRLVVDGEPVDELEPLPDWLQAVLAAQEEAILGNIDEVSANLLSTDASVNRKNINIKVLSMSTEYDCGDVITAGDVQAYVLDIEFMNVDQIEGICNLHFVRGDGQTVDTFGEIDGNHVRHVIHGGLYAVPHLTLDVQFVNSNLFTPLRITFSGIRLAVAGPAIEDLDPYPDWIQIIQDVQDAIDRADQAAENAQNVADTIQDMLDNGEFIGPMGPMPDHEWDAYSLRFQNPTGWGGWTNLRGATGKTAYEYAVEHGWTDTENVFGEHLAHVDRLFYDTLRSAWVRAAAVTQSQMEDLITNVETDPYTVYFVQLPEDL